MNQEEINRKTNEIWEKYSHLECTKRPRLVFPDFRKNPDILFVGINPAFKDSLEGYSEEELKQHETKNKATKKEEAYQYFRPFYDFTDNWEHIDLFFLRETNQNKVKEYLGCKKGISLNEFAKEQLDIFIPILKLISPKTIVVNNAFASDIIKKEFKKLIDNSEFEKEGFDKININGNKIPIFFCGMLSGQRALDRESKRRLIWQINSHLKRNS
jgi:hypothetical protein